MVRTLSAGAGEGGEGGEEKKGRIIFQLNFKIMQVISFPSPSPQWKRKTGGDEAEMLSQCLTQQQGL